MYKDYIIESDYYFLDDRTYLKNQKHFEHINVTTNNIILSNGRMFFLCRFREDITMDKIQNSLGNTGKIIADGYENLLKSDYPYKYEIFECQGFRSAIDGTRQQYRGPLSSFVCGDEIEDFKIYPPILWAGDSFPNLKCKLDFLPSASEEKIESVDKNKIIFLTSNLGIENSKVEIFNFFEGIRWVPSILYGTKHQIFSAHYHSDAASTFTGCLEIDIPGNIPRHGQEYVHYREDIRGKVRRLITAVSLITGARPTILKEICIHENSIEFSGMTQNQNFIFGNILHTPNISGDNFQKAYELAIKEKGENLTGGIRNALDAIAHANLSWDSRITYILLWAAIEALSSDGGRDGLTIHNSLVLIGANKSNLCGGKYNLFQDYKDIYNTRSKLVHSFKVPNDEIMKKHTQISLNAFKNLFAEAVKRLDAGECKREIFAKELIKLALSASIDGVSDSDYS